MTISISIPVNIEIRSQVERDVAMSLVQKLSGAPEDTAEEFRLLMLIEAIEVWDAKREQEQAASRSSDALLLVWMPMVVRQDWLYLRTGYRG